MVIFYETELIHCEFRKVRTQRRVGASKASVNHFDSNKIPKKCSNMMSQNDFLCATGQVGAFLQDNQLFSLPSRPGARKENEG